MSRPRAQRGPTRGLRTNIYRDAVAIVEAEYASDLRLADIAGRVFTSRRHLQRCYAEIGDTSFRRHLTSVRMQRAAELLATKAISVREAALSVAYPHPAQFAKAFRQHHGVTPSAFRAQMGRGRRWRDTSPLREVASGTSRREAAPGEARSAVGLDAIDWRVTHVLRLCDRDHDDLLDAHDFEEWVDRLGALRGWEPDCDGYRALTDLFIEQGYRRLQATTNRRDGRMPLHVLREILRSTARSRPQQVAAWADALFDVLDDRGTGEIGLEQYRDLLSSLCVMPGEADAAFAQIDIHARGRLSRSEFKNLYLDFFLDDDPDHAAAWLWGRPAAYALAC